MQLERRVARPGKLSSPVRQNSQAGARKKAFPMSSVLIINAAGRETRVALVENGHIAEFYLERKKDKGIVGNIYKGRVTRVLPGMQAAFVDCGLDKAAFLYVADVLYDPDLAHGEFDLTEGEHEEHSDVPDEPGADDAETTAHPAGDELIRRPTGEFEIQEVPGSELPPPTVEAQPQVEAAVAPSGEGAPPAEAGTAVAPEAPAAATVPSGAEVVAAAIEQAKEAPAEPKADVSRELRARKKEERREKKLARIEDLLKPGQEVLVQVSKDPIGTKGARVTAHISIPGRHLVFMPTVNHVGISRRIGNEKERRRLRETVDRMRPDGTGFIVRTVAENVPQEKLEADIRFLIEVWNATVRKNEKQHRPGLMHPDLDLILRATRDLFAQDVEELVIDDRDEYERVKGFVAAQDQELQARVKLHEGEEPIFDAYGVEDEVKRATARKVWLKSGGYLIIDQAEALTAVDVNSGRYVGKKSLEETITKINTEAAKEIVYQLRLRNIGGIIICDFIDMEKSQNRDKVFKTLQEALGRDKAKTNVLRISELGLVEMTRKRVRESIGRMLHEECAYCSGQGFVKTASTVAYELFRELRRSAGSYKDPTLVIHCQTDVGNLMLGEERDELRHLMDRFNKSIQVKTRPDFHREQYDIFARPVQGVEYRVTTSGSEKAALPYGQPRNPGGGEARALDTSGGGGGGGGGGGREGKRDQDRGGRERGRGRGRDRDRGRRDGQGGSPGGGVRDGREPREAKVATGEGSPEPRSDSRPSAPGAPDTGNAS